MRLSYHSRNILFGSLSPELWTSSWPTVSSMSCDVIQTSEQKPLKNQTLFNSGIISWI